MPRSLTAQPNFRASVPRGQATSGTMNLSLADAVRLGLERNLAPILTANGERTAQAERLIALSRLLPQIRANVSESSNQINLAAFGFQAPGFPSIVGPFKLFDARAYLNQTIFNLRQVYEKRASERQLTAATLDSADARDTVVEVVTALYWDAVSSSSRISAAEAQVTTAEASYRLAEDRRTAGLAPAIDVLRAQVELQTERQRLIASRSAFEKAKLSLAEAVGLPSAQRINLTDTLNFAAIRELPDDAAIEQAYLTRKDYQGQLARLEAAEQRLKGASRIRVPSLAVDGDYGVLGKSPINSHGTYSVRVGLNIPIFAGGAERAELDRQQTEVSRQKDLLEELRSRIGFEVRSALLDLNSASEQVTVSRSALDLAGQQVMQARDRFGAGVTDTLEVVQAQEGLAAANESYITSLYAYNLAKVRLARALGGTEQNLTRWTQGVQQ